MQYRFSSLMILLLATCLIFVLAGAGCKSSKTPRRGDGFVQLFNGKNLKGWEGDRTYWRVENGNVVGEVTPATPLKVNTFLIWRGGVTRDFELKTDFRITADGNSGINYRSEELKDIPFALKGYQADIDGKNAYTGLNYEERGRGFMARRGQKVNFQPGGQPEIEELPSADSLVSRIRPNDWNEYHLIVSGNHMQHYINGFLMSDLTDNDSTNRKMSGLLGLQVHVGPPMKVEYRNVRLKQMLVLQGRKN